MTTGVFICARLHSSRLPGKALCCLAGRPLLQHLLERMLHVNEANIRVLCTTTLPEDDILVRLAQRLGVQYFRGSKDDVLQRMLAAALHHSVDVIAVATGDNPFTDPNHLNQLIYLHNSNEADYSYCKDLPLGVNGHVLSRAALDRVCRLKFLSYSEIWPPYFTESGIFHVVRQRVAGPHHRPDLRLTVDTPQDLQVMQYLLELAPTTDPTLDTIINILDRHPELQQVTREVQQKSPSPLVIEDARSIGRKAGSNHE